MFAKYVVLLNLFSATFLGCVPTRIIASQSVHLAWVAGSSPDVVGYNVYYGSDSGIYSAKISGVTATELNVDGLQNGLIYYFVVTAFNSSGQESEPSNEAAYGVTGIAPPPGSPFILQTLSDHAATLGWNPSPSATATGYLVYYGTQSGIYDQVISVSSATQVDVHGLADGVTYYFAVAATNSSGQQSALTPEILYRLPELLPPPTAPTIQQALPPDGVSLTWPSSPSMNVAGYRIYYGTLSGNYGNWMDGGQTSSIELGGLLEDTTYYFAVAAYDSNGQESVPSAETSYHVAPVVAVTLPVLLSLEQLPATGFPNVFALTATGPVPAVWTVEASPDLKSKSWRTLATGSDAAVNVTIVATEKPALFFRLNSWFEDIPLQIQAPETNALAKTLVVSTPYAVPWDWTLESSENLADWSPLVAGFFTPVNVAIVNSAAPALFFRLKGED